MTSSDDRATDVDDDRAEATDGRAPAAPAVERREGPTRGSEGATYGTNRPTVAVRDGPDVDYDVPTDATVRTCPECGRPFPDADLLALHRGLDHEPTLSESERAAVDRARSAEERRLRLFRLKALAALVLLYFGLLMVYAVVT